MKKIFTGIMLLMLSSLSLVAADSKAKHLFILSGQSNMSLLDPAISFTPTVEGKFGKNRVIVVKDAMGAQPIKRWYKQWKSVTGTKPKSTGDLYDRLMNKVKPAIKGQKIKTVTFVWMQGERDARKDGDVYAASLKGLLQQLKKDLKRQRINFVIGRINDFDMDNKKFKHWIKVRKAQEAVAKTLDNAALVNTDDLNGESNGIHADDNGYKILGQRFANSAIALIENKPGQVVNKSALGKDLPKVLIIGDSISNGYTPYAQKALKGSAEVTRRRGNCEYTGTGLKKLDKWIGKTQWDVIHFNWGLWDIYGWGYAKIDRSPVVYEDRLNQLLVRLKKTGATLIWCTTTPVCPEAEKGMKTKFKTKVIITAEVQKQYRDAALRVMKKHKIEINDLYSFIAPQRKKYATADDNVHYTKEGYKKLGEQVAKEIKKRL
ncbi:MAG: hypothetical protein HRT88_03975 [Lentisphaeraceae bacterium]|nr:hypothetical protein [Lentisphaeraceae bacterium]